MSVNKTFTKKITLVCDGDISSGLCLMFNKFYLSKDTVFATDKAQRGSKRIPLLFL